MALEKIILKKGTSTATTYTDTKVDSLLANKQPVGNYATLGSDGKVPSSQLPSYVDDVLEYTSRSAFPATGEAGKIYIAKDTNKTYRWSGSGYVEISASLALGETASTAYAGDKGKANADAISALQSGKADKATTLAGYGITDAYTEAQVDAILGSYVPLTKNFTNYSANYAMSDGQIEIFVKNTTTNVSHTLKISSSGLTWKNQAIATTNQIPDVTGKADKATTLAGYGITDAYTKTQVDAGLSHKADTATTLAGYGITDAYTKTQVNSELDQKADKATTLSGYGITSSDQLLAMKLDHTTTFTDYRTEFVADNGGMGMVMTKLSDSTEYYALLTPQGLTVNDKKVATEDQIPDISGKADHTTTSTSADGKTITFTFD